MSLAFWTCAVITAASAAVGLGFSIAGLAEARDRGEGRTASMSACTRSVALSVVAVAAVLVGSVPFLVAIAVAMVIVQGADTLVGALLRDPFKTAGPALTAAANLAALLWLGMSG